VLGRRELLIPVGLFLKPTGVTDYRTRPSVQSSFFLRSYHRRLLSSSSHLPPPVLPTAAAARLARRRRCLFSPTEGVTRTRPCPSRRPAAAPSSRTRAPPPPLLAPSRRSSCPPPFRRTFSPATTAARTRHARPPSPSHPAYGAPSPSHGFDVIALPPTLSIIVIRV
jgi:hypothetical protein